MIDLDDQPTPTTKCPQTPKYAKLPSYLEVEHLVQHTNTSQAHHAKRISGSQPPLPTCTDRHTESKLQHATRLYVSLVSTIDSHFAFLGITETTKSSLYGPINAVESCTCISTVHSSLCYRGQPTSPNIMQAYIRWESVESLMQTRMDS